ncbi:hypothetical protein ST201phi2-1p357 [Pseudomonas phage 201phi2-1]|uniref:Uncharacterized protein n=1 Tax=Pseudomonas phage 201phi2-1 TaxID=198110 RepID=B3FJL8_BP201|nr:hypothetical protein ST201phi2-1p357 [Pseudomonas phage 201phi2-1]ABY63183.1 hypothetical protein 201phi2-1p357 [Pseudomonas phage 201phi2-1]
MIKGRHIYSIYENTIGIVPGNKVQYRIYKGSELLSSVNLIATKVDMVNRKPVDDYRLWMTGDERQVTVDARAVVLAYQNAPLSEGLHFELEVI